MSPSRQAHSRAATLQLAQDQPDSRIQARDLISQHFHADSCDNSPLRNIHRVDSNPWSGECAQNNFNWWDPSAKISKT